MRRQEATRLPGVLESSALIAVLFLAALAATEFVLFRSPAGANDTPASLGAQLMSAAPPAGTNSPKENAKTSRLLKQLLFRHRRHDVMLTRAQDELAAGNTVEALAYLQSLLDQPQDSFVWRGSTATPLSARREAARMLSSLDSRALLTYQRLQGPQAKQLLAEARRTNSRDLYAELGRRFYHTAAGFEAVDWLSTRWLDRGHFTLAAQSFSALASAAVHRHRVTPALRRKASVAQRLSRPAAQPIQQVSASSVQLPVRRVRPAAYRTAEIPIGPQNAAVSDWSIAAQTADSQFAEHPTAPYPQPIWNRPLWEGPNHRLEQLIAHWEKEQTDSLRPVAVANFGIVVGERVIVRDLEAIRAIDLGTGQPTWNYNSATSLAKAVLNAQVQRKAKNGVATHVRSPDSLQRVYAGNSTLGLLTSDGQRVYAVDFMEMIPWSSGSMQHRRSADPSGRSTKAVSREANRLIALELNPSPAGPNQTNKPVWSIGGAVGAPNWFFRMDQNDDGLVSRREFRGETPQFRALDTDDDGVIRRSEADAGSQGGEPGRVLAGHFFLGPPLPVGGMLFALTEWDRQLNLVCLESTTGSLLWRQGLGFVEKPIHEDPHRYPLACSLCFGEGIVVCPTHLGAVVAVDTQTGSLLWAYDYTDRTASRTRRWSRGLQSFGHSGFATVPRIKDKRIVLLPRRSAFIHCIDLHTGEQLWKVRRDDAEYIGALTDDLVLIVGRQFCRGLSLQTGSQQWSTRLGMPSGRGILAQRTYLLPLQAGRVATLDVATGQEIGFALVDSTHPAADGSSTGTTNETYSPPLVRPGNLVAGADVILSVGCRRLVAFPQAAALLRDVSDNMEPESASTDDMLLAGELELVLGNLEKAKPHLLASCSLPLPSTRRRHAETLARELLYLQLQSGHAEREAILNQLGRFARTPSERGRYLIQRAEYQLRNRRFDELLQATREFSQLDLTEPLPMADDPTHLVSAASWIPSVLGRVPEYFDDSELERVRQQVDHAQQLALKSSDVKHVKQFLAVYTHWHQADALRTDLARQYIRDRRYQEAEFLLLANRASNDRRTVAVATWCLVNLWNRLGLSEQAASLLAELEERYADVLLDDGRAVRQHISGFPRDSLTWSAFKRLKFPDRAVSRVRIVEERWISTEPDLQEAFGQYRRHITTPHDSPYHLLDKGTSDSSRIALIDRQSGFVAGHVSIPAKNSYGPWPINAQIGHFFPLGSERTMNGISLIDHQSEKPFWTTVAEKIGSQTEPMRVGPSGPTFCTFQSRHDLYVVEPATGKVLWQRTDLDPKGGLYSGTNSGLFGDENVLVYFSSDRTSYSVYRTTTGEEMRYGKLDDDAGMKRIVFGRKLFYVSHGRSGKRFRIWDPWRDELVLDVPITGSEHSAVTPDNELALVLPHNRLKILDVVRDETLLEVKFDPGMLQNLSAVRVFRDQDRYYINLDRGVRQPQSRTYNRHANNTFLPIVDIQGDLYAVDRFQGRILWKRSFPPRSVVRTPHVRLPFLVTMSRLRDRWNGSRQSLLIEAVDVATGDTLGMKDNIYPNRIVQLACELERGQVKLHGMKSTIVLEFDVGPSAVPRQHEPL
jgi:hypothetical protein